MPLPPRPYTFHCPICSWKKTAIPPSDVLVPGRDWYGRCVDCGHEPLERQTATRAEIMRARLEQFRLSESY
ncbi:MAG TPA: hypothetical protein DIC26_12035 [Pseudomonas sp.]|nr:hypothetical protein [Pseudomonas sp.]